MKNKNILLIMFIMFFFFGINVNADDVNETCDMNTEYYNFYLFTEALNANPADEPTIRFAQPYDYFANEGWIYNISEFGAISVGGSSNTGEHITAGKANVTLDNWTIDEWYKNFKTIYNDTSGYTFSSTRHASQTKSGNRVVRFIVAGNAAKAKDNTQAAQQAIYNDPKCTYKPAFERSIKTQPGAYDYTKQSSPKNFVSSSAVPTYIAYTNGTFYSNGNAQNILEDIYTGDFYGVDNKNKKFKIYRGYKSYKPFSTMSGISIMYEKLWSEKENKWYYNVNKNTILVPAAFYIKYTCRKPCDPSATCCYTSPSKNGYNSKITETEDHTYHYKYVRKTKDPDSGEMVAIKTTNDSKAYDGDPDYDFVSCGCDPKKECCYDEAGDFHPNYTGKHYNNYKYIIGYGTENEAFVKKTTSNAQRVTCGCDPNKKCCYDANGNWKKDGTGNYVLLDPTSGSSDVVSCSCSDALSPAVCNNKSVSSYDEVSGNTSSGTAADKTNDTTCTMKGEFTKSGFSLLNSTTRFSMIQYGYDVVCKDSYNIQYPDYDPIPQNKTKDRWFMLKIGNEAKVAKVTVKRECVTTRLSTSAQRKTVNDSIIDRKSLLSNNSTMKQMLKATLYYDDIKDIKANKVGVTSVSNVPLDTNVITSSTNTYVYGDSYPVGIGTKKNSSNYKDAYYMKRIDLIEYSLTIPDIYLRSQAGDTVIGNTISGFSEGIGIRLPKGSLPIKLSSPASAGTGRNYKVTLSFNSIKANRTSVKNYTASPKKIPFTVTGAVNETYSCKYKVVNSPGNPAVKPINYFYRTIALADINPQSRKLGLNWNYNNATGKISSSAAKEDKLKKIYAYKAKKIANPNDKKSYFVEADNDYEKLKSYADGFSFKLTPSIMQMIRKYNYLRQEDGGYNDWDLYGVDYGELDDENTIFKERYTQQANKCGWHWYSPFLTCMYYGKCGSLSYTYDMPSGCKAHFTNIGVLGDAFGNTMKVNNDSKYDLNENRVKLVKKQNKEDHDAYVSAIN